MSKEQARKSLVEADIQSIHRAIDDVASDEHLSSGVRDVIDALRIALESGDLGEETVAEMLNTIAPE